MTSSGKKKSALSAASIGIVVFALIFFGKMIVSKSMPSMTAFRRQVMLEILLGATSILLAKAVFHVPHDTFSITKGFVKKIVWKSALTAFILGILATIALIVFHASGIPIMKQLPLHQLLIVLFMASISEELLTRGLVQGMVRGGTPIAAGRLRVSPAVIAGASVFSLIHLSIYLTGGDYRTTIIVMLYAFVLGIVAGKAKERSNMGAAILTHLFFNVGGITGGILINVISVVVTGHLIHQ